jgi:hypothetical protein
VEAIEMSAFAVIVGALAGTALLGVALLILGFLVIGLLSPLGGFIASRSDKRRASVPRARTVSTGFGRTALHH